MKHRLVFSSLLLVLFLALAPTALASNTWYVDGVHGKNQNDCKSPQTACKTIGHAISLASSGDSIMVAAATYIENLTIGFSLKVIGSGAPKTIINGGGVSTVITISKSSAHVTLSKLTIQAGYAEFGGGIYNTGTLKINNSTVSGNTCHHFPRGGAGGGIYNTGTLTINNSTVSGNTGGGFINGSGGGIANTGTLTINNSTASGNRISAAHGYAVGGGIANGGTLTINNSTISQNSAYVSDGSQNYTYGGGIDNGGGGTLTINNSTISRNSASGGERQYGGGIENSGTATVQNSIVANNTEGRNCSGRLNSKGYNLSSDATCRFNGPGDLKSTDPKLGTLGNYGGPTQTIPLLSGSPAIDAGNPNGCTDSHGHLLKTDQRGRPRPDDEDTGGCDMGAYERQKD